MPIAFILGAMAGLALVYGMLPLQRNAAVPAECRAAAEHAQRLAPLARGELAALAPATRPADEPAPAAPAAPTLAINSFADLIALAATKRDLAVKAALERDVRAVRCEDGRLEIALEPSAVRTLVNDLARKFTAWTGKRWMVVVSAEAGALTVKAQAEAREAELKRGVRGDPLVQAVLKRFPGAEIVGVSQRAGEPPTAEPLPDAGESEPE